MKNKANDNMNVRAATIQDKDRILQLHMAAFPQQENQLIARLAASQLTEISMPQGILLIAETGAQLRGHIALTPVRLENDATFRGHILAPLAVQPDQQGRGIGTQLVRHGLQTATALGTQVVFVYGDPKYYGRFGFLADTARPYRAPYPLTYPQGWLALELNGHKPGATATAITCVASLNDPRLW